jgi:thioredoxin 1
MSLRSVDDESFSQAVLAADRPVLVDFWAERCLPCVMLAAVLEEVAETVLENIGIVQINVDENPVIARQYGVTSLPTLILFKGGELRAKQVGALPKSRLIGWVRANV